jgi:putative ABC transport system ATP-binding protein
VLLGPSGSGKTTLLSLLAGLMRPTSGAVRLFGDDIGKMPQAELQMLRARSMGFVFQTFHLFDVLKVVENITIVQRFAGTSRRRAGQRALELLDLLDIADLAAKYPVELSQGQKQRVAIARAMANEPRLLLADEPTASLEWRQGHEVVSLLQRCARDLGCCVVCATHDLRMREVAGRICTITDGVLEEAIPPSIQLSVSSDISVSQSFEKSMGSMQTKC